MSEATMSEETMSDEHMNGDPEHEECQCGHGGEGHCHHDGESKHDGECKRVGEGECHHDGHCEHGSQGAAETLEMGCVEDLTGMVSIQEHATVSRTVMQQAGGNVVVFSFDTGEELSEHTAAMPVFVQVLKGRIHIHGGDKNVELVPGGMVYFPTRLPHAVKALEPSIMMLTMITPARA